MNSLESDDVADITAAERTLYRAMIAQDCEVLKTLLADDVVYIHSTAVAETKDGYLAGIRNGLYDYGSIDGNDVTIRRYGDVAVQTGTVTMSVGARNAPKAPITLLFTLVWKRDQQRWRLWQRHATRIPVAIQTA